MRQNIRLTLETLVVTLLRAAWHAVAILLLWAMLVPELLPSNIGYVPAYGLAMGIEFALHLVGIFRGEV